MQEIVLEVIISAESPINIGSGEKSKNGTTKLTVRDDKGRSYIPGTTLKGALKQSFRLLVGNKHHQGICSCDMCKLFGTPSYAQGKMYIDNFEIADENERVQIRKSNKIDRRRGVCVESALFQEEAVFAKYKGEITAYIENEEQKQMIINGLHLIEQIGSGSSKGMGRVKITTKEKEQGA